MRYGAPPGCPAHCPIATPLSISQLAVARGAESVILFTDLANPASNWLYIKLG